MLQCLHTGTEREREKRALLRSSSKNQEQQKRKKEKEKQTNNREWKQQTIINSRPGNTGNNSCTF
jgi:hypothetical protein